MDNATQPPLLRALAMVPPPVQLPRHIVEACSSAGHAVLMSIQLGRACRKHVLAAFGWRSASQLTELIAGRKNFPMDKGDAFARVTGNLLVQQWFAHRAGHVLTARAETIEEAASRLATENAQLRAQVAATMGARAA